MANATYFDACKFTNMELHLNSNVYLYDDMDLDFDKKLYAVLYEIFARFRKTYYKSGEFCLNIDTFLAAVPVVAIDCLGNLYLP